MPSIEQLKDLVVKRYNRAMSKSLQYHYDQFLSFAASLDPGFIFVGTGIGGGSLVADLDVLVVGASQLLELTYSESADKVVFYRGHLKDLTSVVLQVTQDESVPDRYRVNLSCLVGTQQVWNWEAGLPYARDIRDLGLFLMKPGVAG